MASDSAPRNTSTLEPPLLGESYANQPSCQVGFGSSDGGVWYRAYTPMGSDGEARDSRYFSAGNGRFDLPAPRGSLNLASSPEVAFRERLGRTLVSARELPSSELRGVWIARIEPPRIFRVADFRMPGLGIAPGDISSSVQDYSVTQKWAEQMQTDGFEGIIARSRFGNGSTLYLFGDSGENRDFGICIDHHQSAVELVKGIANFPRIVDVEKYPEEFDFE